MKKGLSFVLMILTLVVSLVVGACAAPTSAPTTTPTTAPTTAPKPPETIELLASCTMPDMIPLSQLYLAWSNKVTELSKGRVKFTWYWMSSLIQGTGDTVKSLKTGVADVAQLPMGFEESMYLHDFARLTFLGLPDTKVGTEIYMKLLNSMPELKAELQGIPIFGAYTMPTAHLHTTNKLVKTPAEAKGMKIIALGNMGKLAEQIGAAPVQVGFMDFYMSLERGVAQGIMEHFAACDAAGLIPITPYHTMFGDSGIAMNLQSIGIAPDTWNKLPPDIQKIFTDLDPWLVEEMIKMDVGAVEKGIKAAKDAKQTFAYLTPEEIKVWAASSKPLHDAWIKEVEARGFPAQKLYDEVTRLIAEYSK